MQTQLSAAKLIALLRPKARKSWSANVIALDGVPQSMRDDEDDRRLIFNIEPVGLGFGQNRSVRSLIEQLEWAEPEGLINEPIFCQRDNQIYTITGVEELTSGIINLLTEPV